MSDIIIDVKTEKPSARATRVAEAISKFRTTILPYPPQQDLMGDFDELYQIGRATRGEPQEALLVLQPTGAGKTTAAKLFIDRMNANIPCGSFERPAIMARCAAAGSSKALAAALLDGAGAKYRFGATEDAMWKAWNAVVERFQIGLIFIDEVQHCQDSKFNGSVTNTIKNRLGDGPPIVLLGTRKGEALFTTNDELNSLIYAPVTLNPLAWHNDADRDLWTRFSTNLDQSMVDQQIVARRAGLGEAPLAEHLCEAALGRVGLLKKIVQMALRLSLRRGADSIDHADLKAAVAAWSMRNRFIGHNPLEVAA